MAMEKILVVDDEKEIKDLIALYLKREGFEVISAANGHQACSLALTEKPDLILLDILLPGQDGIDVCTNLRKSTDVPIIFVSCKNEDVDKIIGLRVGGDDYITKPFSPMELVARVNAHLRRNRILSQGTQQSQVLNYPGLKIDLISHTVYANDIQATLTAKEFELLVFLAQNPNRVFYTRQIFQQIWGNYCLERDSRTVMVHMSNLRKKIEADPSNPKYIATIRGIGYKFNYKKPSGSL